MGENLRIKELAVAFQTVDGTYSVISQLVQHLAHGSKHQPWYLYALWVVLYYCFTVRLKCWLVDSVWWVSVTCHRFDTRGDNNNINNITLKETSHYTTFDDDDDDNDVDTPNEVFELKVPFLHHIDMNDEEKLS